MGPPTGRMSTAQVSHASAHQQVSEQFLALGQGLLRETILVSGTHILLVHAFIMESICSM